MRRILFALLFRMFAAWLVVALLEILGEPSLHHSLGDPADRICRAAFALLVIGVFSAEPLRNLLLMRRNRRRVYPVGKCPARTYDLRARHPGGKCPECRTPVTRVVAS